MPQNSDPKIDDQPGSSTGPATTVAADRLLDITADTCPMTFVRTRLALDAMAPGQTLLIRLRGAEPRTRVPQTACSLGHTVLAQDEQADGTTLLLLRRR